VQGAPCCGRAGRLREDAGLAVLRPTWGGADTDAVADNAALCVVAEVNGSASTVIGHLIGRMQRPDPLRPGAVVAVLESMRVDHSHRGAGVGTRLIAEFLDWAQFCGANEATVQPHAANTRALRFYRARGFARQHVSPTLEVPRGAG
jgi:GNAT superfamily N-acetyltransferase